MGARYRRLYRFFTSWEARRDEDGQLVVYGDIYNFEDAREAAVQAHMKVCQGDWVTSRMVKPTVGPLIEYLIPDDEKPSTMSRETEGGPIRPGQDLWSPQPRPEFTHSQPELETAR